MPATRTPRALFLAPMLAPAPALALALALLAGAPAAALAQSATTEADASTVVLPVREADLLATDTDIIRKHVFTLANPFYEGRLPGTIGAERAADYLEFYMKRAGLTPAFAKDGAERASFRQPFNWGSTTTVTRAEVSASAPNNGQAVDAPAFEAGDDFNVLGMSATGKAAGPLAFVGYAIPEGPDGYSSFPENADLTGTIALVLRFEPINAEGRSRWGEGGSWSERAGLEPKLAALVERGVAGIILVSPPGAQDPRINRLETADSTPPQRRTDRVPTVMMTMEAADRLVRMSNAPGVTLESLRRGADEKGEITTFSALNVTIDAAVERTPNVTDNVGGILPGVGDLADEFVVIGAHYDHLGYGAFGSREGAAARGRLHPGADDNASGTSGMLRVAERLAAEYAALPPEQPRRSVLFLGFSAEESGLNGARHYVRNPIVPIDRHALMINLDMIGRLRRDKLEVTGVGSAQGLEEFVTPFFESSGLDVYPRRGGRGPSDHDEFFRANVPVLFFFTGLHAEYHTSKDTFDTINPEGAARIADLAARIALGVATRPERMPYNADAAQRVSPFDPDRLPGGPDAPRAAAPAPAAAPGNAPAPSAGPGMGGMRVRFGIAPGDYSASEPGILVGEVFPATTAAEAGLRAGDRLVKWNGTNLTTVESWMGLLTQHSPGDKVTIEFVRDGKTQTATATLRGRERTDQ